MTTPQKPNSGCSVEELEAMLVGDVEHIVKGEPFTCDSSDDVSGNWPTPEALPSAPCVPGLSPELLPRRFRQWLVDRAGLVSLPLEYVAVPAVVAAGAVVGRALGIQPSEFSPYVVVSNLWGCIIGPPGVLKSAAQGDGLGPLDELEKAARKRWRDDEPKRQARLERLQAEIGALKKKLANPEEADQAQAELVEKLRELQNTQAEPRYMTNDATVEKLGVILQDNPEGILIERDELAGLIHSCDRQGREGDRQFYLQGWEGHRPYTSDRIGRGTTDAIPVLSVIGSMQPGKLDGIVAGAIAGGDAADGLLQRFQLTVWPDRLPPYKSPTKYPDQAAYEKAKLAFDRLDAIRQAEHDGEDGPPVSTILEEIRAHRRADSIPFLRFTPEAQERHDEWRVELETRLRDGSLDESPAFTSHLGKYRSLIPTLALLFHLIDGDTGSVTLAALDLALKWAEFLEAHARKIYAPELSPGIEAAHKLLAKMRAGRIQDGMTVRDIKRANWSGLKSESAVNAGMDVLVVRGWVRIEERETGGRPSPFVYLHPQLGQWAATLENGKTRDNGSANGVRRTFGTIGTDQILGTEAF